MTNSRRVSLQRKMKRLLLAALAALAAASAFAEPVRRKLHILPVAFSKESQANYQAWIEKLRTSGFGNAIWQEIEDVAYDDPRFTVIQETVAADEFAQLLEARQKRAPEAGTSESAPARELPDYVVTINVNFFVRATETLKVFSASKSEEFRVTIYLRYYDLASGAINVAVPAQADAVGVDPMVAARQAVRSAWAKLLTRLEAQNRIPAREVKVKAGS
jgi:hypothetical protein